jgi:hypothetical protein
MADVCCSFADVALFFQERENGCPVRQGEEALDKLA